MTDHFDDAGEPVENSSTGISRGRFLDLGAVGFAATMMTPTLAFASESGAANSNPRILLRGGVVLTLDDAIGDFIRADVLIERGKIVAVAPNLQAGGAQVVNCSGMIVTPGFVDTHRHMWQGLLRSSGPDDLLLDYLQDVLMGFALNLTPEEVNLGDLIAALLGDERRGHDDPRLVAHQHDACAHRRRDRGAARVGDPRRLWLRPQLLPPEPPDQPVPERHLPAPEPVLLVRGSAADPRARRGRARSSPASPSPSPSGTPPGTPTSSARISVHVGVGADGPGWVKQLSDALLAGGHRGLGSDTTYIHSLHAHRPGAGSRSRTRAGASRSPARSSCRWGTGCRRSRRRSTATSRSA